jgi:TolB-like protein/Tfp pilus assembly protein PilF
VNFEETLPRPTGSDPGRTPVPPVERWRDLTILEPLGAGARGEVWRAWDATLQRDVALKFLQPSVAGGDAASSDLLSEARALARVRHPSIVTVFGIAEDAGRAGMWMECVRGVTLAHEIGRVGALPAQRVAWIGLQLCSALEALRSAGLVHRDIKPANIMLEGEERVVLTDFGLGWRPALGGHVPPEISGTPLFLAPEVLAGEMPTHQSDLYALGVTLWWALAGEAPFRSKTFGELRLEAARGPSRPLHSIRPEAPRDLVEAILLAMKPSPAERARSAGELTGRFRTAARKGDEPASRSPSIAVLPFVNLGPGIEDQYFSDGLADELIGMLGKIRGLRVAARTSAFRFRDRRAAIGEIGGALHVDTVLDGSVRRSGNRIRISVQLVKVADGLHLWSDTYDRMLDDIFAVQDDIAQSAVQQLRAALLGEEVSSGASGRAKEEVANAARGRTADPEAHRLYLLARHYIDRWTREDMTRAVEHLKDALARDPQYAAGWAELSRAYTTQASCGWAPVAEANGLARQAAERAVSLRPDLVDGHVRLAWLQMTHDWDWRNAQASLRRARELAPEDDRVLHMSAILARNLGRPEDAVVFNRRALDRDPLSSATYLNLGLNLYAAGRAEEAEAAFRESLEFAPDGTVARASLGLAMLAQGRTQEALAEVRNEPEELIRLYALAILHATAGEREESDRAIQALVEHHAEQAPTQIAEAYAVRGEANAAFEWLERAYSERDGGLTEMRASPHFATLQGDPRWREFLAKMGLESVDSL